jgi:uncharacterized protein (AIM24 family)
MTHVRIHGHVANITLESGHKLRAESDSCIGRTASLSTALTGEGDWLVTRMARSTMNKMFGGENMLSEWFEGPGEVNIADPLFPGNIVEVEINSDDVFFFKQGAWLASDAGIVISPTYDSLGSVALNTIKGALSNSLILQAIRPRQQKEDTHVHVQRSRVFINSFGTIHHRSLLEGETYYVDTKNLLGWTNVSQSITLAGGLVNSVATGEGFEFEFKGPCDIVLQSASKDMFIGMLVRSPELIQQFAKTPRFVEYIEKLLSPTNERIGELERRMKALRDGLSRL